ncbi:Leucine-rich repeat protein soc-2 homolog, partial [Gryllus bimaculatus]
MDIFKQLMTECQQDDQCVDLRRSMLKEIPTEIYSKNSENIQFLYLEENEIAVLPDDFFPTLRHLKWLDMRNNFLQCIPSTIANHENLETLLLKNNKIETLPLELGTLARLRGLQLQGNPLRFPAEAVVRAGAEAVLRCLREEAAARAARGPVLALPPPPVPSPPPPQSPPPPSPPRRART